MMSPVPEIWKDIKDYEGYYQVSNLGEIKSLKRIATHWNGGYHTVYEKILTPVLDRDGYCRVTLTIKSKKSTFQIHCIVMAAFEGESELQVNHKKGIKTDNRFTELEYVTCLENIKHRTTELRKKKRWGVYWHDKLGKWRSIISISNNREHLGIFINKEDAYEAYYQRYLEVHKTAPWSKNER